MYQAFICCSHADRQMGDRLHRDLSRYRLPPGDADKTTSFYLDRFETPTGSDFNAPVQQALEISDWLIVPCTPDTGRSVWINEQILTFQERGAGDKVLCLIVSGQPGGSALAGLENRECLPEAVRALGHSDTPKGDAEGARIIADIRTGHGTRPDAIRAISAVIAGTGSEALQAHERRRRLLRRFAVAGLCAVVIGAGIATVAAKKRFDHIALIDSVRDRAMIAHRALDANDLRTALRSLQPALTGADGAIADHDLPVEALTAFSRVTRDTRLLAEIAVPAVDVETLRLLPTGVLAAVEGDGRTHLIDLGAGDVTTVYDPPEASYTQISIDGRTLWTAHFEPSQLDETGEEVAPLVFEEAELATGDVRMVTAVQSVPAIGGSAEISPDGRLFAIDLGPGSGDETVIAVFHREAQALAGVLTLPSDQADLHFIGPEHLLVLTDPPGQWDSAPGIYIWRIGDSTARTLRRPDIAPTCSGNTVAPDAPPAIVSVSPDHREVALALSGAGNHGCFLRWALPSGQQRPVIHMSTAATGVRTLSAGGPYLIQSVEPSAEQAQTWMLPGVLNRPAMEIPGCAPGAIMRSFGKDNDRLVLCISEDGFGTLHRPGGITVWRGMLHPGGVSALAYDRVGQRLFTIGEDGMLRVWDVATRLTSVGDAIAAPQIVPAPDGDTLIIGQDRVQRWEPSGARTGNPINLTSIADQPALIAPLSGKLVGVAEETDQGATFAIHDMGAEAVIVGGGPQVPLTRFTGLAQPGPATISVSPTGRRFLLLDNAGAAIWGNGLNGAPISRVELTGPRPVLSGAAGELSYVLIASDSNSTAGPDRKLYLYAGSEAMTPGLIGEWKGISALATLSPDGKRALILIERAAPERSSVALVELKSGAERTVVSFASGTPVISFSPDGRYLHIAAGPEQGMKNSAGDDVSGLLIQDAENASLVRALPTAPQVAPVWSRTGEMIAVSGGDGIRRVRSGDPVCQTLIRPEAKNFAFDHHVRHVAFQQTGADGLPSVVIADLETCTTLTGFGADLGVTPPHFVAADTMWIPLPGDVLAATISTDLAPMRLSVAARLARLGNEEER